MPASPFSSEFLQYLASLPGDGDSPAQLPSLDKLSHELQVSIASLREQLEVARALGLVEVRPRTGIRRLPFSFSPAVRQSLSYAMTLDVAYFNMFSDLRNHLEAVYWHEAVGLLTPEDHDDLQELVGRAWEKLRSPQIQIPHSEHRELHLAIFRRLANPFVQGILEAYWDAYVAIGLNLYADYDYLEQVWGYHQQMVEAICTGKFDEGYRALVEHRDLLSHRPVRGLAGTAASPAR
jgi:DNA-binding FadR family transcriptional regulator